MILVKLKKILLNSLLKSDDEIYAELKRRKANKSAK